MCVCVCVCGSPAVERSSHLVAVNELPTKEWTKRLQPMGSGVTVTPL